MYEYVPVGEAVGVEGVRQQLPRSTHFIVLSNSTSSDTDYMYEYVPVGEAVGVEGSTHIIVLSTSTSSDTDYMYEYVPVGEAVGVEGVRQQLPRMREKLITHFIVLSNSTSLDTDYMYECISVKEAIVVWGRGRKQLPRMRKKLMCHPNNLRLALTSLYSKPLTSSDTDYMYECVSWKEEIVVGGERQQLPRMREKLMCHPSITCGCRVLTSLYSQPLTSSDTDYMVECVSVKEEIVVGGGETAVTKDERGCRELTSMYSQHLNNLDTDYMYECVSVKEAIVVWGRGRKQLPRMRKKLMCHPNNLRL
ncbi:hypothetical protein J6590_091241 [Homalodisca vitripennis]|nr:hypothetical protein J6590_091241 [Homalodisca vitripennis]